MVTPYHKNPCPRSHDKKILARPFLGHHNYTLSLSDLHLSVDRKIIKKNNAFSLYDLNGHALPSTRIPA